jgi:hypothetical protein
MKDEVKHEIKNIPLVITAENKKAKERAEELEAKKVCRGWDNWIEIVFLFITLRILCCL